jgi:hypothetical protein
MADANEAEHCAGSEFRSLGLTLVDRRAILQPMSPHTYIVLNVTLAGRDDGGLNVSSDDLPGLILSGSDRQLTAAAIAPAIKAIFEHRGFRDVMVHHGTPIEDLLPPKKPQSISVRVEHGSTETEQFVVEVSAQAA